MCALVSPSASLQQMRSRGPLCRSSSPTPTHHIFLNLITAPAWCYARILLLGHFLVRTSVRAQVGEPDTARPAAMRAFCFSAFERSMEAVCNQLFETRRHSPPVQGTRSEPGRRQVQHPDAGARPTRTDGLRHQRHPKVWCGVGAPCPPASPVSRTETGFEDC